MTDYLNVLDLFSGPGGLSEGFKNARNHSFRFNIVVANDNDPNAAKTYQRNHPSTKFILGSISEESTKKKILSAIKEKTRSSTVDLVIGGPPCKGFSLANKMTRDMQNPMNHLVMHFVDMIKRTKPLAFVMENVPGLLSMDDGRVVESLISEFKLLGYKNTEAWLLNAADYGVPQIRKRAFLVGSKSISSIDKPIRTYGNAQEIKKKIGLEKYTTLIKAIGDLPKIQPGKTHADKDEYAFNPQNDFQMEMRKFSNTVTNHTVTRNTPLVITRIRSVPPGGNWADIPKKLMQVNGKYSKIEKAHSMIYRRMMKNEPCITLTNFRKGMIIHPTQHRLLSVREAARIQTFPDHFQFEGGLSSQQQQVSDAVPVKLAKKVGDAVLQHMHQIIRMTTFV
ncbi:MAG: DNA cytosine methyltransferase [Thaumarchaeota archaeon]|nr:DNA cytosine methyltransferase [Nitrososphaerota archaeon]